MRTISVYWIGNAEMPICKTYATYKMENYFLKIIAITKSTIITGIDLVEKFAAIIQKYK